MTGVGRFPSRKHNMSASTCDHRGLFICLEGGEGSGKTTMAAFMRDYLQSRGREVVEVYDPGSTLLAQRIREIVVDKNIPCTPEQQALLYITARDALADEVSHQLDIGVDVVCGRWTLSTFVYQGIMGGVDLGKIRWLATNFIDVEPDIYVLLDATPELALARKLAAVGTANLGKDRFDSRSMDWHVGIRNAYFAAAQEMGYPIVDADRNMDEVTASVLAVCQANPKFRDALGLNV